ncbi:MAG: hypothetical protein BWY83_03305 [bacterium ADurb.Bin478]|nr:MAG: hypothetical protein BWY83_03305 [bacterium ADurb.Bin478]
MALNPDFYDLLKLLNDGKVEYLVVGGYAVMYYSEPRFTKDLDIWINPVPENARAVWRALAEYGAPLEKVSLDDFCNLEMIYQIGLAPNRIDILMDVAGVDFAIAWQRRKVTQYGDVPMNMISREDLIAAKLASGREQDLLDAKGLQKDRPTVD